MRATTEPTANACTLVCRLRSHVITTEGDFVPAKTPVKVMGWMGNGSSDEEQTAAERREMQRHPKVTVRTIAYMHADVFDYKTGASAVGRGLYLDVDPSNLVFDEIAEDFPRD